MTPAETKALERLAEALPQLTDFQKGQLIGRAEAMMLENETRRAAPEKA